jgi:hypothetical protein
MEASLEFRTFKPDETIRTEGVMRGIKEEYHEKLREVQKTTAMKVL